MRLLALGQVYVLGRHVCVQRRESLTLDVVERHKQRQRQGQGQRQGHQPDGQGCTGQGPPAPGLLSNISARPLADKQGSGGAGATATVGGGGAGGGGKGSSSGPSEGGGGDSDNRSGGGGGSGGGVSNAVLEAVAVELSGLLGLTMFNFDVVEPMEGELGHREGQEGGREEQQCMKHGPLDEAADEAAVAAAAARGPAGGGSHGVAEAGACGAAAGGGGGSPGAAVDPRALSRTTLYVVDVNYFPGYDKLSGWEGMLAEHLGRAVGRWGGKGTGEAREGAGEGGLDGCGVADGRHRGSMPRDWEEAAAGGGGAGEEGSTAKRMRC